MIQNEHLCDCMHNDSDALGVTPIKDCVQT
jgi:hypothetical protein